MPAGWAVDETGNPCTDPNRALQGIRERTDGGILPLGGVGEVGSGYKGFALALLVEIMCAALSGSATGPDSRRQAANPSALENIGHFFGAFRVSAFRPVETFKAAMDDLQRALKNSPKAPDQERIKSPVRRNGRNTSVALEKASLSTPGYTPIFKRSAGNWMCPSPFEY